MVPPGKKTSMSWLFILAAVIGLVVLVGWPFVARRRQQPKRLNQPTVSRDPIPPAHPTGEAPPGSAPQRHRQGKP